ncbi:hypothetical protein B0H13DRAFT_1993410 [Mycena leptocephala]|nr:hypothetical protein B0H13DRAFT_1993410 [Mycena leptocephala]
MNRHHSISLPSCLSLAEVSLVLCRQLIYAPQTNNSCDTFYLGRGQRLGPNILRHLTANCSTEGANQNFPFWDIFK